MYERVSWERPIRRLNLRKNNARFLLVTTLLSIATVSPALAQATAGDAYGYWVNRNGWLVEVSSCDDGICGSVVGMRERTDDVQRFDIYNPDPNLRQRAICGIEIFGAFKPNGAPGEWEDGWIYNPQDGKTYSSEMKLGEGDTLEVRGYVLSPIFGRTIVFTRGEEPAERCNSNELIPQREANAG